MASRQDRLIFAFVALRWAHVLDAAVMVIDVVPVPEVGGPSTRSIKVDEAPGGELWAVLGGAKQRLRVGVVITHPGSRVRVFDSSQIV